MPAAASVPPCPICGQTNATSLGPHDVFDTAAWYCPQDDLGFCAPAPTPDELARHYQADYRQAQDFSWGYYLKHYRRALNQYRYLRRHGVLRWGDRALDVGCNFGALLDYLNDAGLAVRGTELHEPAIAAAPPAIRPRLVATATYSDLGPSEQAFDIVLLSHVIEHFSDPVAELTALGQLLTPGGFLFIETPQVPLEYLRQAGQAEGYGDHLLWLTETALRNAAAAAGFTVLSGSVWCYGEKAYHQQRLPAWYRGLKVTVQRAYAAVTQYGLRPLRVPPKQAARLLAGSPEYWPNPQGYNIRLILQRQ